MSDARYTIVGNDGKQYGPIGAEEIRVWRKQARVDSRTPIFVTGAADWTFLGLLPEFAAEFTSPPPVIAALKPAPAHPGKTNPLALWGFICSVLAWSFCGCCVPFAIVGLALAIIGLVQLNSAGNPQEGRGFAIAGIVLAATNLLWSLGWTLLGFLNDASQIPWQVH
ncbi:MAG: hypothetical protein RL616_1197 [Verrucomicrobiota bacterium]